MTMAAAAAFPVRDPEQLVRDKEQGLEAWRGAYARRSTVDPESHHDREAQMDARRAVAGLRRTRSAMLACQARADRRSAAAKEAPRAVVVHRSEWLRSTVERELTRLGVRVVGEGEDGAVAVALVVVEQPDLLVIEDRLPWVTPRDVVAEAARFAPHTVVVVQLEDSREAEQLLDAGATAVLSRGLAAAELCQRCVDAFVTRRRMGS